MKILKVLKEQEETPNNLDVIDGGTYGFMKDSLVKLDKILNDRSWEFSTDTFTSPDGSYRCTVTLYVKSYDTEINLSGKIYLGLKSPEIPLDFLSVCAKWMIKKLKDVAPDLMDIIQDPRYKENSITFNFKDVFVSYSETFLSLYDYMDRAYYNTHVINVLPIEELMTDKSIDFNYKLEESQVPKFSEEFSLATDKMIKKIKSVYYGFRKGTFKGHQYEYKEKVPRISIHLNNHTETNKVIHPNFRVSINAGYVWIDGKPTSEMYTDMDRFQDREFIKEFETYIKARFEQFGIKIM